MAAVTVTARGRRSVIGDQVSYAFTVTAADTNTLTVPGVKSIKSVIITVPLSANEMAATWSGNVITFATNGTITGANVTVLGRD